MSVKFGNIELKYGLMLAPMAGVTDRSFRRLCHEMGSEYAVSEMVSAKALVYEQQGKRRESTLMGSATLAALTVAEGPMAVQLFGKEPSFMAEAAKMLEASSYRGCTSEVPPVAIDINMGCPMRKITGNGEGSALMRTPELAGKVCEAVVKAVDLPVTVKIRAGWDSESINASEMARILEASGASLICVHARTREQLYTPGIDLKVIEAVKSAVKIPVIGNGDICCGEDAINMMSNTGCDGVMIGRGAMGDPWIFSEIRAFIDGVEYTRPSVETRIDTAIGQLDRTIEHKGERVGLAEGKKHMAWYLSGIRGAATARNEIMIAKDRDGIVRILQDIKKENS